MHPGPPYYYRCLKCGHRFDADLEIRKVFVFVLGPKCPECKSSKVFEDMRIVK